MNKNAPNTNQPSMVHVEAAVCAIHIGFIIKQNYPTIGEEYLKGKEFIELVYKYKLRQEFPFASLKTLQEGVRLAIKGYPGDILATEHPPYEGLVSIKRYNKYVTKKLNLVAIASGMDAVKRKDGIHGRSLSKRKKDAAKGHRNRKYATYLHDHKRFLLTKLLQKEFWRKSGDYVVVISKKITRAFNRRFFGKNIPGGITKRRTRVQIKRAIFNLRSGHSVNSVSIQKLVDEVADFQNQLRYS